MLLGPIFDAIADEMSGVSFGRINVSFYPEIADEYKVNAMPTLLYFRNGELVHQSVGSLEREELLEKYSKFIISVR